MDWSAAIEKNHEALKRVLATIVAAHGTVVKLPPPRKPRPKPKTAILRNG